MSRASVLAAGRTFAAGGLVDTCTIRRIVAVQTDQLDARVTYTQQVVYTGVCRVQQVGPGGNMAGSPGVNPGMGGQASNQIVSYILQLPVDATTNITPDDEATINTCVHDAALVGRKLRVQGLARATHKTTRRISCIEVA